MAKVFQKQFQSLVAKSVNEQLEFFLKRYIFLLGEDWGEVTALATKFSDYTAERNDTFTLNVTEAADFLQKNGKTRTAQERKEELRDIDLDNNGEIAFIEYLLLHYKVMVLRDYFAGKSKPIPKEIDLSRDGIGVTGVGSIILEALFTFGKETDPKIEAAIEQVLKAKQERDFQIAGLKQVVKDPANSQVQRMKAHHEMLRIEKADTSEADKALITLMAGRRRVARQARNSKEKNEKVLKQQKQKEEAQKLAKKQASKDKLAGLMNRFQNNAKTDDSKYQNNAKNRASIQAISNRGRGMYTEAARKDY